MKMILMDGMYNKEKGTNKSSANMGTAQKVGK